MIVILISGGSGSGKTTLAGLLCRYIGSENCLFISQDNYYFDISKESDSFKKHYNYDIPDAIDFESLVNDVGILKNGGAIKARKYDFVSKEVRYNAFMITKDVIVVEGLFSLYDERLMKLSDCSIFIDVSVEVRLERRLTRDVVERGFQASEVMKIFNDQVEPMYQKYISNLAERAVLIFKDENLQQMVDRVLCFCKLSGGEKQYNWNLCND